MHLFHSLTTRKEDESVNYSSYYTTHCSTKKWQGLMLVSEGLTVKVIGA